MMKKLILIFLLLCGTASAQYRIFDTSINMETTHPMFMGANYLALPFGNSNIGISYNPFTNAYITNGYLDFLNARYAVADSGSFGTLRIDGLGFYSAVDSLLTDTLGTDVGTLNFVRPGYITWDRVMPKLGRSWLGARGREWSHIYGNNIIGQFTHTRRLLAGEIRSESGNVALSGDIFNFAANDANIGDLTTLTMRVDSTGWDKQHLGLRDASNDTSFSNGVSYDPRVLFENTFTAGIPLDTLYTWVKKRGFSKSNSNADKHERQKNRNKIGSKKGIVFFRIDDNGHYGEVANYADLFNNYGNWTWTLNLSRSYGTIATHVRDGERERESLETALMHNIEFGDHTPNHTPAFASMHRSLEDYDFENGQDGIDTLLSFGSGIDSVHFSAHHTLLTTSAWGSVDRAADLVSPNLLISQANGDFDDLTQTGFIISLGLKTELYRPFAVFNAEPADPDTIILYDRAFTQAINRASNTNQTYYIGDARSTMSLTQEGVLKIIEASKLYFDQMGLKAPKIWMQTGAGNGHIQGDTLQAVFHKTSIIGARTLGGDTEKTYSNRNPVAPFRFEWGDFIIQDGFDTAAEAISIIADGYAKNYAMGNNSHLVGVGVEYYARVDSVLQFCKRNNIPVMAMGDAIEEMFYTKQDQFVNIFPPSQNDFDEDGVPDAYTVSGTYVTNDGVHESDSTSFTRGSAGTIFTITGLGGLEPGINDFRIWTKGAAGDSVSVSFTPSSSPAFAVKYPADTADWTYYESGYTAATKVVFTHDDINTNVVVAVSDYSSGTVGVAGIEMRKK